MSLADGQEVRSRTGLNTGQTHFSSRNGGRFFIAFVIAFWQLWFENCMSEDKLENKGLKKAGLKVTLPRLKILSILEKTPERHISAEEVYKKLLDSGDDVGLATVYRVLTQFEAAGLVIRHRFDSGHAVFELDGGQHHDHLVCIKCGKVEEFVDKVIEERQIAIAEQFHFKITDHCLYLYGTCGGCQSKQV